jgi:SEC-C motif-containing protein
MRCPCRKKSETRTYAACCAPCHEGARPAPTAEALMRSRYAAFALGKRDYLLATWHPTTRPARLELTPGEEWLLLRVIAARETGDTATVEFTARSRLGQTTRTIHELSRFVRENGRWLYVDGDEQ